VKSLDGPEGADEVRPQNPLQRVSIPAQACQGVVLRYELFHYSARLIPLCT